MADYVTKAELRRARMLVQSEETSRVVTVSGHFDLDTRERLELPHNPDNCSNVRCVLATVQD